MPARPNSNPSSPSTPRKKQTFSFVRAKLETKIREFRKTIHLNAEFYNQNVTAATLQNALINNLPVSHSGRTLAEILSLSHPKELSLYAVDKVTPGYGKEGTVVQYSGPEPEIEVGPFLSRCLYPDTYTGATKKIGRSTIQVIIQDRPAEI